MQGSACKGVERTGASFIEIFFDSVPKAFLDDVVLGVFEAYQEAHDETRDRYDPPEAHDLVPYLRRAKVERAMRAAAEKHGLVATVEQNAAENCFHTRIMSKRVVITESVVPTPATLVRSAEFRKTYARSNQLVLPGFESAPPLPDAPIYAIILHGPDRKIPSLPAFIKVAFPNAECTGYLGQIDLILKAPQVSTSLEVEQVGDDINIRLRRRTAKEA